MVRLAIPGRLRWPDNAQRSQLIHCASCPPVSARLFLEAGDCANLASEACTRSRSAKSATGEAESRARKSRTHSDEMVSRHTVSRVDATPPLQPIVGGSC